MFTNFLSVIKKWFSRQWERILAIFVIALIASVILGILFVIFCVTWVDNYELAFSFDRYTGQIEKIDKTGWVVRMPIRYAVHTIDLRPYQISLSANSRILNAKLVRFKPEGLDTFVEWHGRSAGDHLEDLKEILKCYAFDKSGGEDCPFLEVLGEIAPSQTIDATANKGVVK